VVLGTHVDLSTLAMVTGSSVNVLTGRVGANEADSLDVWVGANTGDCWHSSLDDIDDTIGHARFLEQVNQDLGGSSDFLRWLQKVGVSESNAERVHPEGNHGWEVEWGNTSANTEWRAVAVNINSTGNTLDGLTHAEGGKSASVLDHLVSTEDVSFRVDDTLAVLLGDHGSDVILVLLEELLILEHVSDTLRDGDVLPAFESFGTVCDGLFELCISGLRHMCDDILGQWADHVDLLGGTTVDPFSIDEVAVLQSEHGETCCAQKCL